MDFERWLGRYRLVVVLAGWWVGWPGAVVPWRHGAARISEGRVVVNGQPVDFNCEVSAALGGCRSIISLIATGLPVLKFGFGSAMPLGGKK